MTNDEGKPKTPRSKLQTPGNIQIPNTKFITTDGSGAATKEDDLI